MRRLQSVCALAAGSVLASAATGQWIAESLHPPGTAASGALAIDEDALGPWPRPVIAGYVRSADDHAGTWDYSFPFAFASVHPDGWDDSHCLDVQGGQRVGFTSSGTGFDILRAALWNGDPAAHVNLHPAGALASEALGVYEGQQVGYARFTSGDRAGFWTGDAASWTELHPAGAHESAALTAGADDAGPVQAGWVRYEDDDARAALWRGTPESLTNLHPAGFAQSWIYAVADGTQAGVALVTGFGDPRAALWRGTAGTFLSLHPDGAQYSVAYGMWDRYQVGLVRDAAGTTRAMLWRSRADRREDLHAVLPPRFSNSKHGACGATADSSTSWALAIPRAERRPWCGRVRCPATPTSTAMASSPSSTFSLSRTCSSPATITPTSTATAS